MMDDIDGSVLLKDDTMDEPLTRGSLGCGNPLETVLLKQKQLSSPLVTAQELHVRSDPKIRRRRSRLFSAKELSSSIIASESTRIICAVLIALLVVLSYIDYPLLGINIVNSKSIIAARPLYMLLVTEITVLLAHLVMERRRRFEDFEEDDMKVSKEGGISWDRAVRVLERGLVSHQTVRAVFIDCSVYVVIVVCGLSLV